MAEIAPNGPMLRYYDWYCSELMMFPEKHEAAECLQRTTIDKSPSYTSSYLVLTICLVEQGREDEAEEARPGNQSQSNDLKFLRMD